MLDQIYRKSRPVRHLLLAKHVFILVERCKLIELYHIICLSITLYIIRHESRPTLL